MLKNREKFFGQGKYRPKNLMGIFIMRSLDIFALKLPPSLWHKTVWETPIAKAFMMQNESSVKKRELRDVNR